MRRRGTEREHFLSDEHSDCRLCVGRRNQRQGEQLGGLCQVRGDDRQDQGPTSGLGRRDDSKSILEEDLGVIGHGG